MKKNSIEGKKNPVFLGHNIILIRTQSIQTTLERKKTFLVLFYHFPKKFQETVRLESRHPSNRLSLILHPSFPLNRIRKSQGGGLALLFLLQATTVTNMEESLPARSKEETMSPLNTAQDPIPRPNPVPPRNNDNNSSSSSKKRKQCDADIHNSAYFKILHIVQQLRPHFIEVPITLPIFCRSLILLFIYCRFSFTFLWVFL